jgi:hypothetical protein
MVILYQNSNVLLSSIHGNEMEDYTIAQASGPVNSCPSQKKLLFVFYLIPHTILHYFESLLCVWQIVHKRKIAIAKAQGDMSVAVDCLNKYLEL